MRLIERLRRDVTYTTPLPELKDTLNNTTMIFCMYTFCVVLHSVCVCGSSFRCVPCLVLWAQPSGPPGAFVACWPGAISPTGASPCHKYTAGVKHIWATGRRHVRLRYNYLVQILSLTISTNGPRPEQDPQRSTESCYATGTSNKPRTLHPLAFLRRTVNSTVVLVRYRLLLFDEPTNITQPGTSPKQVFCFGTCQTHGHQPNSDTHHINKLKQFAHNSDLHSKPWRITTFTTVNREDDDGDFFVALLPDITTKIDGVSVYSRAGSGMYHVRPLASSPSYSSSYPLPHVHLRATRGERYRI